MKKCYNCAGPDFYKGRHRDGTWKHSLFEFQMGKFQKISNSFGMGKEVTAQFCSELVISCVSSCNSRILDKILRKNKGYAMH